MARVKSKEKAPVLQEFEIVEYRSHCYTAKVMANTWEEALEKAKDAEFEDGGLDFMEPSLIVILDENGEQVYEEIP